MQTGRRTLVAVMAEALLPSRPTRRKPDLLPSPAGVNRLMKYRYPPHRAAKKSSPSICAARASMVTRCRGPVTVCFTEAYWRQGA